MEGYIKITAEPADGGNMTHTEVHLDNVGSEDISQLVYLVCKACNVSTKDIVHHAFEAVEIALNQDEKEGQA